MTRQEEVNSFLDKAFHSHWCTAKICACMGCINRSDKNPLNITQEEWQVWKDAQPQPEQVTLPEEFKNRFR